MKVELRIQVNWYPQDQECTTRPRYRILIDDTGRMQSEYLAQDLFGRERWERNSTYNEQVIALALVALAASARSSTTDGDVTIVDLGLVERKQETGIAQMG